MTETFVTANGVPVEPTPLDWLILHTLYYAEKHGQHLRSNEIAAGIVATPEQIMDSLARLSEHGMTERYDDPRQEGLWTKI